MIQHFISQLNLSIDNARNNFLFMKYLAEHMGKIDALYLVDNVFDVWTGDENRHHVTEELITALAVFTQHTPVFIQTGWTDFLLGDVFAQRTGITFLPPVAKIAHLDETILLVSNTILSIWHPQYQQLRQELLQQKSISLSPKQQLILAQNIQQAAALPHTQAKNTTIQTLLQHNGMDFAYNRTILFGHTGSFLAESTIWHKKSTTWYDLPHWQQEHGIYLVLSDTEQKLMLDSSARI
ncbi:hypothetical protein [Vitreoscilla stercoraria]|nr:hypothetical protein [Vitreoscilla stercoraria]